MAPLLIPIIAKLAENGLSILGNALLAKGKDALEQKLGVDIEKEIQTEEGRLKLLQLQTSHEEFLINASIQEKEQEIKALALSYADTDSARKMQEQALQQSDVFSKQFVYWFAICWSVFAALYIVCITFGEIPTTNIRFADTILGFMLGTVVATMIQFFFGSSNSSKAKDDIIRGLSK
jgi:hypothetical protein